MSRTTIRLSALGLALLLLTAACAADDGGTGDGATEPSGEATEPIDYEAIGLWDDGPCDEALDPLVIGLMTVFESPVISLGDQALSLEAAAAAFNERGGANGACIEVHTCDDGGDADQSLECVREIDDAGVVATVNDQGTQGQADVSAAMSEAGIPRIASLITPDDWADPNTYPMDAGGTGVVFVLPQALIDFGVTDIGTVRVDFASASALIGLLEDIYEGDATFSYDTPVPIGTTDYTQFVLGAQDAGVGGVVLALGEQEAVQVAGAAQQLGSDLVMGASLGSFPHSRVAALGDYAEEMVFAGSYPPATFDLPVYTALRDDLAASGEEVLQTANLEASPMRSWMGLYALLWMLRDRGTTEFTREGISAMLDEATNVPMLGMFGDEDWTPALDHEGIIQRSGMSHWASWTWDPEAESPAGLEGNFVQTSDIDFDEVLCGSPLGAPPPC